MNEEKLVDLVEEKINGEWGLESLNGRGVKVLRTTNFTNEGRLNLKSVVEREIEKNIIEKKKLIFGDTIIEKSGGSPTQPVGRVVFFNLKGEDYLCNNFTAILRPKKKIYPRYFFYSLFAKHQSKTTERYQNKTTGILNLKLERYLEEETIKVPDLKTQEKIASILEQADTTRQKRKQANQLTEEFLQSAFLELFGDPVRNEKGWQIKKMGEVIKNIRYGTGSPPEYQSEGIPFIRATNIKNGRVEKKGMAFISENEGEKIAKCKIKEGDLIIVRSGVNTGDAGIIPKEYDGAFAGYDLIIQIDKPFGVFYNHLINSDYGKLIIQPLSRRAGQPHLNSDQVKNLEFYFPPLPLQQKFASLVERVEKLREKQRESERELENLFQALMQRYFG